MRWKPITRYEQQYKISDTGQIRNIKTNDTILTICHMLDIRTMTH